MKRMEDVNTQEKRYTGPDGKFIAGNPGKPKGARHMTTKIMEAIEKVSADSGKREDVELVRTLIRQAKKGDMQAMKLIFNYVDGMPQQDIDVTTDGQPLETGIIYLPEKKPEGHGA